MENKFRSVDGDMEPLEEAYMMGDREPRTEEETRMIETARKLGFDFEGNALEQFLLEVYAGIEELSEEEQAELSQDVLEEVVNKAANRVQKNFDPEYEDEIPEEEFTQGQGL